MNHVLKVRLAAILCGLLMIPVCLSAGSKKKAPEQYGSLSFVVVRDSDGAPVKYASVVVHFLGEDGRQLRDGFQLKTDAEGRTSIDEIPYGNLRLQVIAHRLQTYGDDVVLNQAKQEFVIRLKPPANQVSIY